VQKLKDARSEAAKEIEAYKKQKEAEFAAFEKEVSASAISRVNKVFLGESDPGVLDRASGRDTIVLGIIHHGSVRGSRLRLNIADILRTNVIRQLPGLWLAIH
jgi:hypothetical protein